MLYGLATLTTSLPSVADPSDFTNYISQGGAAFIAASDPTTAAQPAQAVPVGLSSGWIVAMGAAAAVAWWYWHQQHHGRKGAHDGLQD